MKKKLNPLKLFTLIFVVCLFHLFLYSRSSIAYVRVSEYKIAEVFCLYTNKCLKIFSEGNFDGMEVVGISQPTFSFILSDVRFEKNSIFTCVNGAGQRVIYTRQTKYQCSERETDHPE